SLARQGLLITKENWMQADIDHLAQSCGVDPLTIEQAAHAVCRRLIEWHGDEPIAASRELIETALGDYVKTVKSMSISAHMHNQRFSRQVLDLIGASHNP